MRQLRRLSRCSRLLCLLVFFLIIELCLIHILVNELKADSTENTIKNKQCVNRTLVRLKARITPSSNSCKNMLSIRGAYVFYITNSMPEYECYLYVLLHQLQNIYPCYSNVHYVILYETGYKFSETIKQFNNIVLKNVSMPNLKHATKNWYYAKCYLKLEVFSLWTEYDRIVYVDADGIFTKDPSPLFKIDLLPKPIGAAYCYWFFPEKWLTSSFFIADLSKSLHDSVLDVYTKDLNSLIKGRKVLDMEIFNWLFKENQTTVITHLMYMDSHYIDENYIQKYYNHSITPYYIHFSHLKPHLDRRISSCLDRNPPGVAKPEFFNIHRSFWGYYYLYC